MKTKRLWAGLLMAVSLTVIGLVLWVFQPVSSIPLVVSPQTTYFTGPLKADGGVDYVAAYNEHYGANVLPEENMAVALIEALGAGVLCADRRDEILQQLAIAPVGDERRVEYYDSFVRSHLSDYEALVETADDGAESGRQEGGARQGGAFQFSDSLTSLLNLANHELDAAVEDPWRTEDHPIVADWLKANQGVIDRLVSAPRRPKFFVPMVEIDTSQGGVWSFVLDGEVGVWTRLLCAHAFRSLGEEDWTAAWRDAMTLCHLGRVYGREGSGGSPREGLGLRYRGRAIIKKMVMMPSFPAHRAAAMLDEYQGLPRIPSFFAALVSYRRLYDVDSVVGLYELVASTSGARLSAASSLVPHLACDINEVTRRINAAYDELESLMNESGLAKRLDLAKQLARKYEKRDAQLRKDTRNKGFWAWSRSLLSNPQTKRARANDAVVVESIGGSVPAHCDSVAGDVGELVVNDLLAIALALQAYRAEKEKYPVELSALVPTYLAEIPKDGFNGAPLHYASDGKSFRLWSVGRNRKDDGGDAECDLVLSVGGGHK